MHIRIRGTVVGLMWVATGATSFLRLSRAA